MYVIILNSWVSTPSPFIHSMGKANKGKSNKYALSWSAGEHMTETQLELDEERGGKG